MVGAELMPLLDEDFGPSSEPQDCPGPCVDHACGPRPSEAEAGTMTARSTPLACP